MHMHPYTLPSLLPLVALVAPQDSVEALIKRGREALAAGKLTEAQAAFDAADAAERGAPRTRVWVVRGWIAAGKFDEALSATDELKAAKAPAADLDYLYGLGFLGMAKAAIASNGGGAFTQSQLEDSLACLQRATKADSARYSDAWLPLAESAWYAQDLTTARAASDKAVALEPNNVGAHAMQGRIAFSQYVAESDESAKEAHWKSALAAFGKVIAILGAPGELPLRAQLAEAHVQCGHLHGFKSDKPAASTSYALAIGWDPTKVDFAQVRNVLGTDDFLPCVLAGIERFKKLSDERDARQATLSWWAGYAQFENAKWSDSESSFRDAVKRWPAYTNSWYYIFRAAFSQQKYAEALDALKSYMSIDRDGLVATLAGDWERNSPAVNYLIGWCADPEKHGAAGALNEDAAFLCGVLTKVEPSVARHWNNLGLFLRDQGDALRRRRNETPDPEVLGLLWDRAYEAYAKSLELAPEDPNYLNDTAVILHYYQKKDFERAQALYEKAGKNAEALLARKDLPAEERAVIETAKRDSADNIRRLKKYLERKAAGEDVDPSAVH